MLREFKTSQKKRTNYIYFTAEGRKIVITPGEDGVTETDIEFLHSMDDSGVDENRRSNYKLTTHLDAYHDGDNQSADDRNKYLIDESLNPEQVLIGLEEEYEHQELLSKLAVAMDDLTQKQKEILKKKYIDKRTNVDIGAEMGVSEAAIRKHLKKIQEKLKNVLS